MARSLSCGKLVFPWVEVGKKLSFADLIKQPAKASSGINPTAVLIGANSILVRQAIFGNQGKQAPSNRTSIFIALFSQGHQHLIVFLGSVTPLRKVSSRNLIVSQLLRSSFSTLTPMSGSFSLNLNVKFNNSNQSLNL